MNHEEHLRWMADREDEHRRWLLEERHWRRVELAVLVVAYSVVGFAAGFVGALLARS